MIYKKIRSVIVKKGIHPMKGSRWMEKIEILLLNTAACTFAKKGNYQKEEGFPL